MGLAFAFPVAHVAGNLFRNENSVFAGIGELFIFTIVFYPLYGHVGAVGVYLVGNIGKQTGPISSTLGWSFLGVAVFGAVLAGPGLFIGLTRAGPITLLVLGLLTPPVFATIGFNLKRRYKQPPAS